MSKSAARLRDVSNARNDEFRAAAQAAVALAAHFGRQVTPYFNETLPHFNALSLDEKNRALSRVEGLNAALASVQDQAETGGFARRMLWHYLRRMRLTAPSRLFDLITADDCIDIYTKDHTLLFANLRFFELFTFSVEELYCRPWYEIMARDSEAVQEQLLAVTDQLAKGVYSDCIDTSFIGVHVVTECERSLPNHLLGTPKFMAPLFSGGQLEAYICVNGAALLQDNYPRL